MDASADEPPLAERPVSPAAAALNNSEFKPGFRFYTAFFSLCIAVLAAALDATSLSTALPVCSFLFRR